MTMSHLKTIEGKYQVVAKIKEGGMGAIYKVRHRLLDELRVVKVLRPQHKEDDALRARFTQEARAAIRLRHPNLIQIFDFSLDESGLGLIVMEYIRGIDLGRLIARKQPPSLALILEMAHQALRALGYLHRQGFVHRDVSPDNLMLSLDVDGKPLLKLIDLGIAKHHESPSDLTETGTFIGKFRYSSPEHFGAEGAGNIGPRSDLYSFGVVLYELLTNGSPIPGDDPSQLIGAHLFQPPIGFDETDPEGRVPEDLRALILRCLAKRPEERFDSAVSLDAEIRRIQANHPLEEDAITEAAELAQSGAAWEQTVSEPGSTQQQLEAGFAVTGLDPGSQDEASEESEPGTVTPQELDQFDRLLVTAYEQSEQGDYTEAVRHLESASGMQPNNTAVFRLLTEAREGQKIEALLAEADDLAATGDLAQALHTIRRARASASEGAPIYLQLRATEERLSRELSEGERRDAVTEVELDIVRLIETDALSRASRRLEDARAQLGDQPAFEALQQVLGESKQEHVKKLIQDAGSALEAGQDDEAIKLLQGAVELAPEDRVLKERLDQVETSLARQREMPEVQELLGQAEEARLVRDWFKSRLLVAMALEKDPNSKASLKLATQLDFESAESDGDLRATLTEIERLRNSGKHLDAWRLVQESVGRFGESERLLNLRKAVAASMIESP